jgi:hypothetical protein
MDKYCPVLAGAAAATPLTRVSRAFCSIVALIPPADEALAASDAAAVEELPLLHPAAPATTAGKINSPDAIRHPPRAITYSLR